MEKTKGDDSQVILSQALGEVVSQYKKEIFYSENSQSQWEQLAQGQEGVPVIGGFQDAIRQGATWSYPGSLSK